MPVKPFTAIHFLTKCSKQSVKLMTATFNPTPIRRFHVCNKSTTIGRTVFLSDRFQYLDKGKITKIQNIIRIHTMASFWIGISTVLMMFLMWVLKILKAPGNNMPFLRCSELNTDLNGGIGFLK